MNVDFDRRETDYTADKNSKNKSDLADYNYLWPIDTW